MQQVWFYILLLILNWILFIDGKAIHKVKSNETLLIGQINGPSGGAARNLIGMILSMNVFFNDSLLHTSLKPITTSTFPLNYSIALNDNDFKLENAKGFFIACMIWQPAFIYENNVKLPENQVDVLNFTVNTIKFVIIRGEIVHDKHSKGQDLPGTHVKLELIHDVKNGTIIDQVDFICTSTKYPCPFEYWADTSRIKADQEYKLEAILADHIVPARNSTHQKHQHKLAGTKSNHTSKFKIDPKTDTEINNYQIVVFDVES